MQEEKFTRFKNEIWKDRNIKGNEKLVLLYLISYNNEALGYSFPTRKQIQDDTGISKDTLGKTLNSLIDKGYITKEEHKSKTGKNNIYYIHKYLVASKKDTTEAPADAKPSENQSKPCETDAKASTTNELLVEQKAKLRGKMSDLKREALNELDTDILTQAIDRANKVKPQGYFIGYILSICDDIKKDMENNLSKPQREAQSNKPSNNSKNNIKDNTGANRGYVNNNYPVKTKYHDTFNEHFRKYTEAELEEKLLRMQNMRS